MPRSSPWKVLTVCSLLPACHDETAPPERPAPKVVLETVAPQDVAFDPRFVAQTESSRQVDIVARVSGYLDEIAFQEGALVQEGQLLFQLDAKPFQADLDAARAELEAQEARFTTATATLNRVKPLAEQDALSKSDLDRAQGEYDASRAAVSAASAKVRQTELDLGYTTIKAPVTGLASRSTQRQGAYINSMSQSAWLTYVAAIDPIWVNFSVSQNQVAKWRQDSASGALATPAENEFQVEVLLPDGTVYPEKGTIDFADPSFSQETGSFLVRAELPNPKGDLRPGMFVTAVLRGAKRPGAVTVPQLAVQKGSNGHAVYVIKQDGTAEVRPVVVGDYVGTDRIVVASGLHAGDRVVVEGALKVVPGQPVQIVEPSKQDQGKTQERGK
jgi:membrane fusion protein (multidrug efflux system)